MRVTRASIATGVITAILVVAATAGTASATSIAQKKAAGAAAEAQLTQLQNAAEKKVETYDLVHQRYQNTLKALHRNQQHAAAWRGRTCAPPSGSSRSA